MEWEQRDVCRVSSVMINLWQRYDRYGDRTWMQYILTPVSITDSVLSGTINRGNQSRFHQRRLWNCRSKYSYVGSSCK